jgi:thioredoxin/glutathione reductase (selenoprotein)
VKHEFANRDEYRDWLINDVNFRDAVKGKVGGLRASNHASSPFCWLGDGEGRAVELVTEFIGGCDDTLDWCRNFARPESETSNGQVYATMVPDGHTPDHSYEYDLVIIGGGSGGLAASKEAASLGARVAVLDYVKPSPAGSTWGLGGTCVNVGCIPKKLMHQAAVLNTARRVDAPHFGVGVSKSQFEEWSGMSNDIQDTEDVHNWELLKSNVQNHIRGLNFKYRVDLREKNVKYLNMLGKFVDSHTLETLDKKGNKGTVTSSRFLIAVGGRPTPLSCEGADLAISSDDIFSLDQDPGKVLCVGASYISLECAGFLRGIGKDVTVAVRSILLRGFDRECADMIGDYMKSEGIVFKEEVVPTKLVKTEGGKIAVTFSNGDQEEYDTVLAAIGRTGDTAQLGLENVGINVNPKNAKIPAKLEQSSVPNIYVIGDVMDGCPELTPVAIHAGRLLSRRLFGASPSSVMDYRNVCTTVFTPIEYGTVGYSEEDAKQEYGEENVEVYHKYFIPLEWSLSHSRGEHQGFCKAIVYKATRKVLGLHYLGPNAGEVLQGFGTAMKLGCKFEDIIETVGIHPTTAEEFTTLSITKESGGDAKASGC